MTNFAKSFVSAPAGSGKTTTLVQRYILELRRGLLPSEIVAITFTRKSAAEMVERIDEVLRLVIRGTDDAKFLLKYGEATRGEGFDRVDRPLTRDVAARALRDLPQAPVMTVDAFAQRLVAEFLLDASLAGGPAVPAYVDMPVEAARSVDDVFEAVTRQVILDDADARGLLDRMTISDLIRATVNSAAIESQEHRLTSCREISQSIGRRIVAAIGGFTCPEAEPIFKVVGLLDEPNQGPALACIRAELTERGFNVPPGALRDTEWLSRAGWQDDHWSFPLIDEADRMRDLVWRLSRKVRTAALSELAREARLPHDEMLRAACGLVEQAASDGCSDRLEPLRRRFRALLVDEVQDTNADQLRLFAGMERMADRAGIALSRLSVGDGRQSIYRFRGADVLGWRAMVDSAPDHERTEINSNYRSGPGLVAFHKFIVDAVNEVVTERGALDDVACVRAISSDGTERKIGGEQVEIVVGGKGDRLFEHVIARFCEVLEGSGYGSDAGGPDRHESSAVLTPSWAKARKVQEELRLHGIDSQLSGESRILCTRVARDVALLLKVLLDPTDEIAWLGLLKHPSIGVPDGAMAALRPFGSLLSDADLEDRAASRLEPHERARLDAARDHLRVAARDIGREPTVRVLGGFLRALRWRELLAAGPEGIESVADLDILLDIVAEQEGDGVDPQAVRDLFADPDSAEEIPARRFERGTQSVQVMTVFQAKGLEFDHLCLPWLDLSGRGGASDHQPPIQPLRVGGRHGLLARIDPAGAIDPVPDPLSALLLELDREERAAERFRMLYVGVTRAKRSLTLAVNMPRRKPANPGTPDGAISVAAGLWAEGGDRNSGDIAWDGGLLDSLAGSLRLTRLWVPAERASIEVARRGGQFVPPSNGRKMPAPIEIGSQARELVSASDLPPDREYRRVAEVHRRFLGEAVVDVPGAGTARTALTALDDGFDVRKRGDLVHGWLQHWGFKGEPREEQAAEFLRRKWPRLADDHAALPADLCVLGHSLLAISSFSRLLRLPGNAIDFEHPIVAPLGGDVLAGRIDLLVRHADSSYSIVDFKGGWGKAVGAAGDLPDVDGYASQLGAYAGALLDGGLRVRGIGLLYVGMPAFAWCEVG